MRVIDSHVHFWRIGGPGQTWPDACFPGRLMWGSDWPVLLHARDSYSDWLQCARQYAGIQGETQLDSLFSGAARSFYGLA